MMSIAAREERWPIAGSFTTARGSKTSADVVVATITDGQLTGRGECLPYPRYGESPSQTLYQIQEFASRQQGNLDHATLLRELPPGSARNAVDCALWDLRAQRERRPVWELAGLPAPQPVVTAFTLSLDTPDAMRSRAEEHADSPLLKVKLGAGDQDIKRLHEVRNGAANARLIVDANEGWSFEQLRQIAPLAADLGVEMIEQPLPADDDQPLVGYVSPVPLGADESIGADTDMRSLATRYQVVNLKLDKAGGLTHAIALQRSAIEIGLDVMIGCMVSTSLSMAPALLLAQTARFVDLDGPLLLDKDRQPGLRYENGQVSFPDKSFWGGG